MPSVTVCTGEWMETNRSSCVYGCKTCICSLCGCEKVIHTGNCPEASR